MDQFSFQRGDIWQASEEIFSSTIFTYTPVKNELAEQQNKKKKPVKLQQALKKREKQGLEEDHFIAN